MIPISPVPSLPPHSVLWLTQVEEIPFMGTTSCFRRPSHFVPSLPDGSLVETRQQCPLLSSSSPTSSDPLPPSQFHSLLLALSL